MLNVLLKECYPSYFSSASESKTGLAGKSSSLACKTKSSAEIALSFAGDNPISQKSVKDMSIVLNPIETINERDLLKEILIGNGEKESLQEFDELINNVEMAAKKDLYLNDAYIEEYFQVNDLLQCLPENIRLEKRHALQKVINEAFIVRELGNKGKLTAVDEEEMHLLGCLGFHKSPRPNYFDKEYLYTEIKKNFNDELQEEIYSFPLKKVREKIQNCVLRTRLKEVGITDELQLAKFEKSLQLFRKIKVECLSKFERYSLHLPAQFPLAEDSINLKRIRSFFEGNKVAMMNSAIFRVMFEDQAWLTAFIDPECTLQQFTKKLQRLHSVKHHFLKKILMHLCHKAAKSPDVELQLAFFTKWGAYLKTELIQGFKDENEILGGGVCWGTVQRMRLSMQALDKLTLEKFMQEMHITSEDRYLQSLYTCSSLQAKQVNLGFLQSILDKYECKDEQVFQIERVEEMESEIDPRIIRNEFKIGIEKIADLEASRGWLSTCLLSQKQPSHAILMRLCGSSSEENHHVWLMDSNIGLFTFEEEHSFEEAKDLYGKFLDDLMFCFYPTTSRLVVNQLTSI